MRLYWDPKGSYQHNYIRLNQRIERWFQTNDSKLGANRQTLRGLVVLAPKHGAGHEGIVRAGIPESLTARGGARAGTPTGAEPAGCRPAPQARRRRPSSHRRGYRAGTPGQPEKPPSRGPRRRGDSASSTAALSFAILMDGGGGPTAGRGTRSGRVRNP